ncbi:MAG: ABC transporter permease [Propionibacteriaceae bacterium]|nr:ABC transporter permease [Propionibacteriaceae bacterium]
MSGRITWATCRRVLIQLSHDHRTLALLVVVPSLLMALLRYMFNNDAAFNAVALPLLGVFPLVIMFLITSVAMLRERTSGTLERLLTTPMHKLDLLLGYGLAFALTAALQGVVTTSTAYLLLGLDTAGSAGLVIAVAVSNAVLGMALGLLVSAFAKSEFQAVQFMPAVVAPQILLCGLFVDRDQMAGWLEAISDMLPMSYSVDALKLIGAISSVSGTLVRDMAVVVGASFVALALGALTLRRRTE